MAQRWTYGEEGQQFPVEVGEIWRCGQHWFTCSDLMELDLLDRVMEYAVTPETGPPTLVYSDPPWGQGLANSFRTKADLEHATYHWTDIYERIADIAAAYRVPLWVECSHDQHPDGRQVRGAIMRPELPHSGYTELVYYRTNRMGLYAASPRPISADLLERLKGHDDDDTPGMVMADMSAMPRTSDQPDQPQVVIDPCAGRGMTSRAAEENGWVSVNNELNPRRVSAALSRLAKMTGLTPEREDTHD